MGPIRANGLHNAVKPSLPCAALDPVLRNREDSWASLIVEIQGMESEKDPLFAPLELPCGVVQKNRIVKSAMSDSLGDGTGHPTSDQIRLYQRWAHGGLAASIVGEV